LIDIEALQERMLKEQRKNDHLTEVKQWCAVVFGILTS